MQQPQVPLGQEGAAEVLASSATHFTLCVARLSYPEAVAHVNAEWPVYSALPSILEGGAQASQGSHFLWYVFVVVCIARTHCSRFAFTEVDGKLGTLRVHERKRGPNGTLFSRDTILGPPATLGGAPKSILRRSIFEEPKPERRVSFDTPNAPRRDSADSPASTSSEGEGQTQFFPECLYCSAPEDMRCDGECKPTFPKEMADVVRARALPYSGNVWLKATLVLYCGG